jgi:hypothetical protein
MEQGSPYGHGNQGYDNQRQGLGEASLGDFVDSTKRAFAKCPKLSGLRLLTAEVRHGLLTARFEGPVGDFRGPYGVIIQLPLHRHDIQWTRYAGMEGTADHWAHAGVAMRALEAHNASRSEDRGYTPDGIWWLIDEKCTPAGT